MAWWYLSFATEEEFLGGCYVEAENELGAYIAACVAGLNPKGPDGRYGSVATMGPLPLAQFEEWVPTEDRWRLLSREEVLAGDGED